MNLSEPSLSAAEACALIGELARRKPVTRQTLCRYMRLGLPKMRIAGTVVFRRSEIERWILKQQEEL